MFDLNNISVATGGQPPAAHFTPVFKALFQVSWKFNFAIETISNTSLEQNYRAALTELEHRMQNLVFLLAFFKYMQNFFRTSTLYVNNLELDNNLS